MVSRPEAVGLPVLGLAVSFAIVLGLGQIATGDNPEEPQPRPSVVTPETPATPPPGPGLRFRVTIPEASSAPVDGNQNGPPPPAPSATPTRLTICVLPNPGWSLTERAGRGWTRSSDGTYCRDVEATTEDLDIGLAATR
jgi:hypothetical protein